MSACGVALRGTECPTEGVLVLSYLVLGLGRRAKVEMEFKIT